MIEYIDHLHEHFKHPPRLGKARYGFKSIKFIRDISQRLFFQRYFPPLDAGYSTEMKNKALFEYEYPGGNKWRELFKKGKYNDPSLDFKKF